jgi:tRNA pseudouridine55 synthase
MSLDLLRGEILLLDKPYKWTSFDVVGCIRGFARAALGIKKIRIGHTGTLDPLATGLLILCTGIYTKKIEDFKEMDKEYTGTFRLGTTTPSFDLETETDAAYPHGHITEEAVHEAARQFTGPQEQKPPMFSAIKIKGRRAYKYARQEQEVVLAPKSILITEFAITAFRLPDVDFRIVCSKGTYIRALARDFGLALGSGAHLVALRRTRIGPYLLKDARSPDEMKKWLKEESAGSEEKISN